MLTGGVLLVAVAALRAARRHRLGRGFEMAIVVPAVLASIHHQTYDALLLAVPLAGVMTGRSPSSPAARIVVATLCLVIALNYLAAGSVLASLHVGPRTLATITTVDAVAVLGLLATYATMALAASARPDPADTSG